MIKVTTLGNKEIVINSDHIERIEEVPETMLTLSNNKKILVRESPDDLIEKVIEYKAKIISLAGEAGR